MDLKLHNNLVPLTYILELEKPILHLKCKPKGDV